MYINTLHVHDSVIPMCRKGNNNITQKKESNLSLVIFNTRTPLKLGKSIDKGKRLKGCTGKK